MTLIMILSAVTNIAVVVALVQTRRRLLRAQTMFKMYVRNTTARPTVDHRIAPWETR